MSLFFMFGGEVPCDESVDFLICKHVLGLVDVVLFSSIAIATPLSTVKMTLDMSSLSYLSILASSLMMFSLGSNPF